MVYFRYVKKNGKQFGPYYYMSARENKRIKSIFLGKNFKEAKHTLKRIPFKVKQKEKSAKQNEQKSEAKVKRLLMLFQGISH